jgi:hypothetical protein
LSIRSPEFLTSFSNTPAMWKYAPIRKVVARRGTTSLEVIVAFTLLSGVMAFAVPLVVAHGRLMKAQRNYRIALDELSNQLDRASTLPAEELQAAIEKLSPSPQAAERLPGAKLRGQLAESQLGSRVTIEIWWDEPNRQAAPVRLTGWIRSSASTSPASGE